MMKNRKVEFARLSDIDSWMNFVVIREAKADDLAEILHLYLYLYEKSIPEESEQLRSTWESIINDENHHLIVCEVGRKLELCKEYCQGKWLL